MASEDVGVFMPDSSSGPSSPPMVATPPRLVWWRWTPPHAAKLHNMGLRPASFLAPPAATTEVASGIGVVIEVVWSIPAVLALGTMTVAVVRAR